MTATPFTPKGTQPEWRLLYDLVHGQPVDTVFKYDQFDKALGRDFREDRGPLARLQDELLSQDKRVLINVRGIGYRVAKAKEHGDLAAGQRKRARRAVRKGVRIAAGTDRSALTADERKRIDAMEHNLREQENMLRRHDERIGKAEKAVRRVDDRVDVLERQLAELERRTAKP